MISQQKKDMSLLEIWKIKLKMMYRIWKNNKCIKIMVYFKNITPHNLDDLDPAQLQLINEFKKKIISLGVFYKEFGTIDDFKDKLRNDIHSLLTDYGKTWGEDNIESQEEDDKESFDSDSYFNGGDVGINDASPSYKLDVNGTFRATGNSLFDEDITLGNATDDDIIFNSDTDGSNSPDTIWRGEDSG